MSFRIKRTTLSPECRCHIEALFQSKHIKADVAGLLKDVEGYLQTEDSIQRQKLIPARAKAKHRRQEILALIKALHGLSADTQQFLADQYLLAYPMPPPYVSDKIGNVEQWYPTTRKFLESKVLNQTEETHFIRMDRLGTWGLPVGLTELIARLLKACEFAEKVYHPRKGAPGDEGRIIFAVCIMHTYELFTKTKATATPSGAFEMFLGYVLEDAAGEKDGVSRRKLIESADAHRRKLVGWEAEEVAFWKAAVSNWGKEKAKLFMQSHVLPGQVRHKTELARTMGRIPLK